MNGEAEERKSDTTTTSNSTVPAATSVGGGGGGNGTTAGTGGAGGTMVAPGTVYGHHSAPHPHAQAMNPYVNAMNPYLSMIMVPNQFGPVPPEHIHLVLNQMERVPAWSGEPDLPAGPYYVVKVSCVATGCGADDRSVGHIALVDWNRQTKANVFVKPSEAIKSYLEPLTSLTPELLDKYGYSLEKAVTIIRSELPSNAVLVGQNITMDLQWLGLQHGIDFRAFIDLRDLWRSWSEHYNSYTHYSLSHQAKCILGMAPSAKHSASMDALTTMKLLQYYLWCRKYSIPLLHSKVAVLQNTQIAASFAKLHPTFEGVTMQSKKYKGVPYITANPNRYRTATTTTTTTNANETNETNDGQQEGDGAAKGSTVTVSADTAASEDEAVAAVPTTATATAASVDTPIDPATSKDAAVIV